MQRTFFLQLCDSELTRCKNGMQAEEEVHRTRRSRRQQQHARYSYLFLGIHGWPWASWIASSSVISTSAALEGFGNGGDSIL
jgi:hypothetical protein